jgi:hypothetical protein
MAAYNDISAILDWVIGTTSIVRKPIAMKKARIRISIQHRILLGLLHETFNVIGEMQGTDEFKNVKRLLSEQGLKALKNLQEASSGGESSIRSRVKLARNSVAFHYDRDSFVEGATIFSNMFVERAKAESLLIYEPGSRAFFLFAEQIREIIAFGFKDSDDGSMVPEKLGKYLTEVTSLLHDAGRFLDELLPAYTQTYSLESTIKLNTVAE